MSTTKKIPWTKKLAKKLSEITVKNKDEIFIWKATVIFILLLMSLSIFYFIRLNYRQTTALLDQTSETVVTKSGFSIENIDMKALEQATILIEYKKTPLTIPSKIRNVFFYEQYENIIYKPLETNKELSSFIIKTAELTE